MTNHERKQHADVIRHVGFKGAAAAIQKNEGVSADSARRIIAAGARKASKKAVRRNPRLLKVKR